MNRTASLLTFICITNLTRGLETEISLLLLQGELYIYLGPQGSRLRTRITVIVYEPQHQSKSIARR